MDGFGKFAKCFETATIKIGTATFEVLCEAALFK